MSVEKIDEIEIEKEVTDGQEDGVEETTDEDGVVVEDDPK